VPLKDEERWAVQRFREAAGALPGALIDSESPDFIVESNGRRIGVEATRYLQKLGRRGSAVRETEALREKVIETAQQMYEASPSPLPLMVYPHFAGSAAVPYEKVELIAAALATVVARTIPPPPSAGQRLPRATSDRRLLDTAGLGGTLTHVDVYRSPSVRHGFWGLTTAAFLSRDMGEIKGIVRRKEAKLALYAGLDEIWLIIYSRPPASGGFDTEILQPGVIESAFDQVVFIDLVSGHYTNLSLRRTNIAGRP
jgi:hypothetical protein